MSGARQPLKRSNTGKSTRGACLLADYSDSIQNIAPALKRLPAREVCIHMARARAPMTASNCGSVDRRTIASANASACPGSTTRLQQPLLQNEPRDFAVACRDGDDGAASSSNAVEFARDDHAFTAG